MPVAHINGRRILFMHVPKAAGSSVTAFLKTHGEVFFDEPVRSSRGSFHPRHQPADVVAKFYAAGDFDHAFMVCRNPVDRIVSEYRYQKTPKRGRGGSRMARLLPFPAWLRLSLFLSGRNPGYRDNHFRPQVEYEFPGCEVFRLEDGIEAVLSAIASKAGISHVPATPEHNRSASAPFLPAEGDVRLIAQAFREDFLRFGYPLPEAADRK